MTIDDKVEQFEVQEHIPYRGHSSRHIPAAFDEESTDLYDPIWSTAWLSVCQLYNVLNHMMIAIVVYSIWRFALTVEPNGEVTRLQMHMIFAGTGYIFFLAEAVLTLSGHNAWSNSLGRDSKRIIHGCFQLVGGIFVIIGTSMIISHQTLHFYSGHGICGLIALLFSIISLVGGVITIFSSKVRLIVQAGPMKIIHISTGLVALVMGLISLALGFNNIYFKSYSEGVSICMIIMTSLILFYVILYPVKNLVENIKRMF